MASAASADSRENKQIQRQSKYKFGGAAENAICSFKQLQFSYDSDTSVKQTWRRHVSRGPRASEATVHDQRLGTEHDILGSPGYHLSVLASIRLRIKYRSASYCSASHHCVGRARDASLTNAAATRHLSSSSLALAALETVPTPQSPGDGSAAGMQR